MAVSARGMFGKEKKSSALPDVSPKFSFAFTYGFALIPASEQKEIHHQFGESLADKVWEMDLSGESTIVQDEKSYDVYDKSIYRFTSPKDAFGRPKSVTLSELEALCKSSEEAYKKALPNIQVNAGLSESETRSHRRNPVIAYCFKLEIKNKEGNSCSFNDFDELQEFIQEQQKPAPKPAKRRRR